MTLPATPSGSGRPPPDPADLLTETPEVTGGSHSPSLRIAVTVDDLVAIGAECRHGLAVLQSSGREVNLAAQALAGQSAAVASLASQFASWGSPISAAAALTAARSSAPLARVADRWRSEVTGLHAQLETMAGRLEFAAKAYTAAETLATIRWRPVDALVTGVARRMAGWYLPHQATVTQVTSLPPQPSPQGVADLVHAVIGDTPESSVAGPVSAHGTSDPPSGRVDVWPLPRTGCFLVALAGTSRWDPPWRAGQASDVRTLQANLQLMSGQATAEVSALPAALERAGVPSGASLVLAGHSQGGLTAMAAATALAGRYRVSHVITAGSPIAGFPLPERVRVLSLEHRADLVPRLDGHRNAQHPRHVTVRVGREDAHPLAAHDARGYAVAANWVDTATDGALVEFRRSLVEAGVGPAAAGRWLEKSNSPRRGTRVVLEIPQGPPPGPVRAP